MATGRRDFQQLDNLISTMLHVLLLIVHYEQDWLVAPRTILVHAPDA